MAFDRSLTPGSAIQAGLPLKGRLSFLTAFFLEFEKNITIYKQYCKTEKMQ